MSRVHKRLLQVKGLNPDQGMNLRSCAFKIPAWSKHSAAHAWYVPCTGYERIHSFDRTSYLKQYCGSKWLFSRSQWQRGVRRGSAAVYLQGMRVRIPSGTWMSLSGKCCVLSGRSLCDGLSLVQRSPTEYVCICVCVSECDREAMIMRGPGPLEAVEP